MIVVVCPNLAVDVTLPVSALELGGVHRTRSAERRAGGKGVNVVRALRALGESAIVVGFAGGRRGEELASGLASEKLRSEIVPIAGETRTCTILLEDAGRATVVNEAGPDVTPAECDALSRAFEDLLPEADAVALMGSLPPGAPSRLYVDIVRRARERGVFSLVDTSGDALRDALANRPSIVKPNRAEAEDLLGVDLAAESARFRAVSSLRERGSEVALVTFGPDGVVVSDGELTGRFFVSGVSDRRLGNPTGAGDALAAGILSGVVRGYSLHETVRLGVAAATASLADGYGRIRAKDLRPEAVRFEPAPDSAR